MFFSVFSCSTTVSHNGQHVQPDIGFFPWTSRTHHRCYRVYGQSASGETAALVSEHRMHIPINQAQARQRRQVQTRAITQRYGKTNQLYDSCCYESFCVSFSFIPSRFDFLLLFFKSKVYCIFSGWIISFSLWIIHYGKDIQIVTKCIMHFSCSYLRLYKYCEVKRNH